VLPGGTGFRSLVATLERDQDGGVLDDLTTLLPSPDLDDPDGSVLDDVFGRVGEGLPRGLFTNN
jgi:hypothetical protein